MVKVNIRPLELKDTKNIIKWRNSPLVRPNFIYQELFTEETHIKWYEEYITKGKAIQFIIICDEVEIGSVYLRDIDYQHKRAEFGIFIGEEGQQGRGVGAKAARLILDYAFNVLELNKVFLRVLLQNEKAARSYKNVGFYEEGVLRKDVFLHGGYCDVVVMSVLKDDWGNGLVK